MRVSVVTAAFLLIMTAHGPVTASPSPHNPVTVYVGSPHDGSAVFGPGEMLCDLNLCRMFEVAETPATPKGVVVEFGLPQPVGQGRIDIRRCLQVCRASVLGYPSERTSKQTSPGRAIFITPIELRLE